METLLHVEGDEGFGSWLHQGCMLIVGEERVKLVHAGFNANRANREGVGGTHAHDGSHAYHGAYRRVDIGMPVTVSEVLVLVITITMRTGHTLVG